MIAMAATNGFRNARGRLAIFKVGSRQIGEGSDLIAGLVHDQKRCVKAVKAMAAHVRFPRCPGNGGTPELINAKVRVGPGNETVLQEFVLIRNTHSTLPEVPLLS
jgi:hypothetical protein